MFNALAQALVNAGVVKSEDKRGRFKAGWNAKLSFRTAKTLKDQGILV